MRRPVFKPSWVHTVIFLVTVFVAYVIDSPKLCPQKFNYRSRNFFGRLSQRSRQIKDVTLLYRNLTRQAMNVERNIEARSCDHCCSGKAISITYSECASIALIIQRAMRMRRIIFSPVACLAVDCV
jgi:hypothetical protein